MFREILLNNLFVLLIYASAGLVVRHLTGIRLGAMAPWLVFGAHLVQIGVRVLNACQALGTLPCLALLLPHAWIELSGFSLGCWAGNRLYRGQLPLRQLAAAAVLIAVAAYTEAYITPFPFGHWLK